MWILNKFKYNSVQIKGKILLENQNDKNYKTIPSVFVKLCPNAIDPVSIPPVRHMNGFRQLKVIQFHSA